MTLKLWNLGKSKGSFLFFPFPHEKSKQYLGAVHGISGILYMFMKAACISEKLGADENFMRSVHDNAIKLLSYQNEEGGFGFRCGVEGESINHFCHGAPGVIYFLCEAEKIFGDEKFGQAAARAGEVVWE